MKQRSSFELGLPLAVFAAGCALSVCTLVIALAWMTIGVCAVGHRSLEDFPADRISRRWLEGLRRPCLWFYHLAWWPWYMRSDLGELAARTSKALDLDRRWRHRDGS
jgi:hypothetical protein